MKYYTNKLNIFEIEEVRRFIDSVSQSKGKPKKSCNRIVYNVIRQLGTDKSRLSSVHIFEKEHENVFNTMKEARDSLISKLTNEIQKILELE